MSRAGKPKRARGPRPPARPGRSRRSRWLVRLAVLACLLAAAYAARRPLLSFPAYLLIHDDPLQKADVALVLAGETPNDPQRTLRAVRLYQEGWVPKIALSVSTLPDPIYETDLAVPLAISQGVPEKDIIVLRNAGRSTLEEARLVAPQLERRGVRTLILVTDNYHTARARRIYLKVTQGRLQTIAHAVPRRFFPPDAWWRLRDGRTLLFREWAKTFKSLLE